MTFSFMLTCIVALWSLAISLPTLLFVLFFRVVFLCSNCGHLISIAIQFAFSGPNYAKTSQLILKVFKNNNTLLARFLGRLLRCLWNA